MPFIQYENVHPAAGTALMYIAASIGNVFLGAVLFHLMFIVAPAAGTKITGNSMIGEYFRVFISYGVITVALIMYETKKRREKRSVGRQLKLAQLT